MVKFAVSAAIVLLVTTSACSSGSPDTPTATPAASTQSYLVTDCGNPGEPVSADSASGASITSDISVLDDDVPVVYVSEGAAPVSELITAELRGGSGDVAALDDLITVEYCGVGLASGALFDASWARGTPATFPLSQGQLIQGWVDGIPGMQVGERRVLLIPSDLAYGDSPPPGIEPGETLLFVVELLGVGAG